jgi:hypothetical protein
MRDLFPFILCIVFIGSTQSARAQVIRIDSSAPAIAFADVSVIPMDSERVLSGYTVIVRNGRIEAVGPAPEIEVPANTFVIDGQGHFLIPGLVDMHVHMQRPTDLELLLVNGVTTVRMMWGSQRGLEWRDQIARGERLGPTMFTSGPILEGHPPVGFEDVIPITGKILLETVEEATAEVARQKAAGYDFIKVYNNLPKSVYQTLIEAASVHDIPVVGHVPVEVGVHDVLRSGQLSVEHLRGYSNLLVPQAAPMQPGPDFRSRELSWQYGDLSKVGGAARATAKAGAYSTPTLMVQIYSALDEEVQRFLSMPTAIFMAPMLRQGLEDRTLMTWLSFSGDDFTGATRGYPVKQALVRGLRDAGAKILAGSDLSPLGFTLHMELRNLVEAGLTPFEALEAATRTAAEALGQSNTYGTVTVGKRADLVLLQANPLDDIANTSQIDGMMLRGRWFPTDELEAIYRSIRRTIPVLTKLDRGIALAREGNILAARDTIEQALILDARPAEVVGYLNSLCWYGSIWGHPGDVLSDCDEAVEEAPGNGDVRDSRGVARALVGDLEGAASDFEAFVDWTILSKTKAQRIAWIKTLGQGENPITEEVLSDLRQEDCTRMVPSLKLCG